MWKWQLIDLQIIPILIKLTTLLVKTEIITELLIIHNFKGHEYMSKEELEIINMVSFK